MKIISHAKLTKGYEHWKQAFDENESLRQKYGVTVLAYGHPKDKKKVNNHVLEDFKEDEEDQIKDIAENVVKLLPTLLEKKIDLFSSKVNHSLNGI